MTDIKSINLMIATPAYNSQVHTDYLHTIIGIGNTGIKFSLKTLGNESLITRARNALISKFWAEDKFTHLLFLDADVYLNPHGLIQMLNHKKEVIGAPVCLKSKDENGNRILNTDVKVDEKYSLQEANRIGTAVLLLSRKAVQALVLKAIEEARVYNTSKLSQQQGLGKINYDIFRTCIVEDEYLSEDFSVCHQLRLLGYKIHVETSVYTRHNGMVAFD